MNIFNRYENEDENREMVNKTTVKIREVNKIESQLKS